MNYKMQGSRIVSSVYVSSLYITISSGRFTRGYALRYCVLSTCVHARDYIRDHNTVKLQRLSLANSGNRISRCHRRQQSLHTTRTRDHADFLQHNTHAWMSKFISLRSYSFRALSNLVHSWNWSQDQEKIGKQIVMINFLHLNPRKILYLFL